MNLKELSQRRGTIFESFIGIEGFVSSIISLHFLHKVDTDFVMKVLGDEQATFGFKRNILKQIIEDNKINKVGLENLATLNRIRNLFGHAIAQVKDKVKKAPVCFQDPKNPNKKLDAQEEFNRFYKLYDPTFQWLKNILAEKGGTLT